MAGKNLISSMPGGKSLKVAFLTRYDRMRASSRVRVYDYLPALDRIGWEYRVLPFPQRLSLKTKASYLLRALRLAQWSDVVVLQKLVLRPEFIRLLKRVNQTIVFDFDDAVYSPADNLSHSEHVQAHYRIVTRRLCNVLREARCIIAGSAYLAGYACQFHPAVYTLPSSVNIELYPTKLTSESNPVVLGWIGSPENLVDFQPISNALQGFKHLSNGKAVISVVSTRPLALAGVSARFDTWRLDQDIEFLHRFDIGLMPLNDTERSRGRCAFKAIQYMAVGLPVIASPVGAAVEVVEHGKTGFLAKTRNEWTEAMTKLVEDPELRLRLGRAGRERVKDAYSVQVNSLKLANILWNAIQGEH